MAGTGCVAPPPFPAKPHFLRHPRQRASTGPMPWAPFRVCDRSYDVIPAVRLVRHQRQHDISPAGPQRRATLASAMRVARFDGP